MKRIIGRLISFIKWFFAWCIGHIFYKGKYLKGKYFKRFQYSQGWRWTMHAVFMQKIIGINRKVPFPVNHNVTVTNWKNMEFHRDNITIFQKPGNYYQASGAKIIIGKDSYIACNVGMVTANHDLKDLSKHTGGKDIVIGANSWIGLNSVVLPGVVLGPHTVVGAGSVVTKSFPEGYCVIAGNPAKIIKEIEMDKTPAVGTKTCMGCMLCAEKCPKGAIKIEKKKGYYVPVVDNEKCIKCGLCNKICPVNAPKKSDEPKKVYALCDKNEENRKAASSGGAVGLLAQHIFEQGGVVSGVVYNEKMQPVHKITRNFKEFEAVRGSKYVQSEMGTIYTELKSELEKGIPVLATGTPCQIAAIKTYFGDKYENLYTCDLICHGVQSPVVFEDYIKELESKNGKKIVDFKFRDKTNGWKKSNVKVIFEDKSELVMTRDKCEYFRYFDYLRQSCYNCHFRGFNNYSDITVGDYWGVESLTDEFNDDKGVSILLCHTEKGCGMAEKILAYSKAVESNTEHALKTHKKLKKSIAVPKYRNAFFDILDKKGYMAAKKFQNKKTRLFKIKKKIKKMIGGK
ncbi:MAG: Coenzyme F420 hydrogenase/dehydrogenase, beta subunit C-terminal domain [Clostridia bacterium]|nr:Coenzyme F420 hydrogenase/dehydrogenase, beta subunit C-terminal domain [Clostridia bacterium]